jgi:hypothetical protein
MSSAFQYTNALNLHIINHRKCRGIWNWEQWVLHKRLHLKEKHLAYFGGQFIVQFAQTLKISVMHQTGKSANCKWISHEQV